MEPEMIEFYKELIFIFHLCFCALGILGFFSLGILLFKLIDENFSIDWENCVFVSVIIVLSPLVIIGSIIYYIYDKIKSRKINKK